MKWEKGKKYFTEGCWPAEVLSEVDDECKFVCMHYRGSKYIPSIAAELHKSNGDPLRAGTKFKLTKNEYHEPRKIEGEFYISENFFDASHGAIQLFRPDRLTKIRQGQVRVKVSIEEVIDFR